MRLKTIWRWAYIVIERENAKNEYQPGTQLLQTTQKVGDFTLWVAGTVTNTHLGNNAIDSEYNDIRYRILPRYNKELATEAQGVLSGDMPQLRKGYIL